MIFAPGGNGPEVRPKVNNEPASHITSLKLTIYHSHLRSWNHSHMLFLSLDPLGRPLNE